MRGANGQLVEVSGVGDVGFLTNVLLVHRLKTSLISEGKLALSGWKTLTYNRVKQVYHQGWNKNMETVIKNEANPLYIVVPVYFPFTENANLTEPEGPAEGIAFAGMADQEGQGSTMGWSSTSTTKNNNTGTTCTESG